MKELKEVSEKSFKDIYLNILKAIIIMLYFFVLTMSYKYINSETFDIGIKALTMIFLLIAIYIFEKAYKKDDGNLAMQGIEILVLSAYTLTTKHITNKYNFEFEKYSLVASYLFAVYFILKSIVVYTKGRRERASELSDIKEILKKTEPTKKEATKRVKKQDEDKKELEVENKKTTLSNKKTAKKVASSTTKTKTSTAKSKTTSTKKVASKSTAKKAESKSKTVKKKEVKEEVNEND